MKTSGIYRITNTVNNKCYIGSGVDIYNRWADHKSKLRRMKHFNRYLQRAWNKYGDDSFVFEVLKLCLIDELIIYEQKYIDILKPEYNIAKKARSMLGLVHTKDARLKMSIASKGNKNAAGRTHIVTEEMRKRISDANRGRKFSKEHCQKISDYHNRSEVKERLTNANKERVWTEESRAKSSASHKGKHTNRLPNGQFAPGGGFEK